MNTTSLTQMLRGVLQQAINNGLPLKRIANLVYPDTGTSTISLRQFLEGQRLIRIDTADKLLDELGYEVVLIPRHSATAPALGKPAAPLASPAD